jgi:DNA-binding NtrC family response regulator
MIRKMKPIILVIDDEEDQGRLFEEFLAGQGYKVLTASCGPEGIIKHRNNRPDLVVLDLKMPKMDGIKTLEAIRKNDPGVIVIILTAYGSADTIRSAVDLNVYEYVSKPFDIAMMRSVIKEALAARSTK